MKRSSGKIVILALAFALVLGGGGTVLPATGDAAYASDTAKKKKKKVPTIVVTAIRPSGPSGIVLSPVSMRPSGAQAYEAGKRHGAAAAAACRDARRAVERGGFAAVLGTAATIGAFRACALMGWGPGTACAVVVGSAIAACLRIPLE